MLGCGLTPQEQDLDSPILSAARFARIAGGRSELCEAGSDEALAGNLSAILKEADNVGRASSRKLPVGGKSDRKSVV